jgi:NADH dehydrogenase
MFYPPDITHLRFTRSVEMKADEERRYAEHDAHATATAAHELPRA